MPLYQNVIEKIDEYNLSIYGNLRVYGKENLEHLSPQILQELSQYPLLGLLKLIKIIHYDYQENKNIFIDPYDDDLVHIFLGDRWQPTPLNKILYGLVSKTFKLLEGYDQDIDGDKVSILRRRINNKDEKLLKFMDEQLRETLQKKN